MLTNYKITFSYDGSQFFGSQKQKNLRTVQSELEYSVNKLFKNIDNIILSGRTDTGVHAIKQVFNFKSDLKIPLENLKYALNNLLPNDIRISIIESVDSSFHSRFSAISRQYKYLFTTDDLPVNYQNYISYFKGDVDIKVIHSFFNFIKGEHYFDIFKKNGSNENTTFRNILDTNIYVEEYKVLTELKKTIRLYTVEITANSFLYRMVRNIMGLLFEILNNKITLDEFYEAFKNRKKTFNFTSATPQGLYLNKIEY